MLTRILTRLTRKKIPKLLDSTRLDTKKLGWLVTRRFSDSTHPYFRLSWFCSFHQICQIMLGSSVILAEILVMKFYTLTRFCFFSVIKLDVQISTLPQCSTLKMELIHKFWFFTWNGSSNWLLQLLLSNHFLFMHLHSALKLEKSAISKVQKHIICIFKNGKKSIFAPEKSLKLAKMQFSDFFLMQKLIFCHFCKCK